MVQNIKRHCGFFMKFSFGMHSDVDALVEFKFSSTSIRIAWHNTNFKNVHFKVSKDGALLRRSNC